MSVFETLNAVNVNGHTEKKKTGGTELTYLSWPYAWAEVKKRYPEASYEVVKQENGLPYVFDSKVGYMVNTRVTIEGVTHEMWLPVMDGANKAMKSEPYTYITGYGQYQKEKTCEAASMFDVNKTIMRCLVKNLAMFGLGLYIYAGEDLPDGDTSKEEAKSAVDNAQPVQASPEAEKLAARAMCQRAVRSYCQSHSADEKEAWKIIADSIGKPSKDFTTEDWRAGEQIAKGWGA